VLIAGHIGSADLRVHAAFGEADLGSFAELRAASTRNVVAVESQRSVWTVGSHATTFDDLWIRSIPGHVVGSVGRKFFLAAGNS
jgi:hypothetical protein